MDPKIKIKTGLSETTLRKLSRTTTRPEPNSPSPTRLSLDRAPANRSRKVPTSSPEASLSMRTHTRAVTGSSESPQSRLVQLKDDLRKANELISSLENDKASLYEKLYEALEAHKMAEENFEIEKFKAAEAGVEDFHRKEEVLKKELEVVKNQHASDSAVLLLVTRELEKVSLELAAANDAKSKLVSQADDASKRVAALKSDQLEKGMCFGAEVKRLHKIIEKLDGEIEVLKMDKSCAQGSADQWCNKAIVLERQLEEANTMKRSSSASLASLRKELEESNKRLHAVESEMTDLKDKTVSMATVGRRQCQDLGKTQQLLETAEKEARKLKAELETVKEEKSRVLSELERWKEEEEKSEIAKESLASAFHQASSEARVLKEKLLSLGGKDYETQAEHYKKLLEEARREIDVLVGEVEQTKMREAGLVNHVKKCDEEVCSMGKEMNRLGGLVKRTKEEADGALKKESQMRDDLKEVEDEVIRLQETLREARGESLKLNAKMLDKETEFQSVLHENDLLRVKQDDSLKKIKELEEALAKKDAEEDDCELCESEQDYDLVETLEENREEKEDSTDGNGDHDDDTVEVEYSMWESYHTGKKEAFHKGI